MAAMGAVVAMASMAGRGVMASMAAMGAVVAMAAMSVSALCNRKYSAGSGEVVAGWGQGIAFTGLHCAQRIFTNRVTNRCLRFTPKGNKS